MASLFFTVSSACAKYKVGFYVCVCVHRSLCEALCGEHRHPEEDHQEEDQSVSS